MSRCPDFIFRVSVPPPSKTSLVFKLLNYQITQLPNPSRCPDYHANLIPLHTNCNPKSSVIAMITGLSLLEGILGDSTQPISTPGMPPSSRYRSVEPLIDPNSR